MSSLKELLSDIHKNKGNEGLLEALEKASKESDEFVDLASNKINEFMMHLKDARKRFTMLPELTLAKITGLILMKQFAVICSVFKSTYGKEEFDKFNKQLWECYDHYFAEAQEILWEKRND
jgi:hypothetical protein